MGLVFTSQHCFSTAHTRVATAPPLRPEEVGHSHLEGLPIQMLLERLSSHSSEGLRVSHRGLGQVALNCGFEDYGYKVFCCLQTGKKVPGGPLIRASRDTEKLTGFYKRTPTWVNAVCGRKTCDLYLFMLVLLLAQITTWIGLEK
eukprot:4867885-Amphidinium_carterae.1